MDIRLRNPRVLVASAYSGMDRLMRVATALAFTVLLVHWAFIVAFVVPRLGTLQFLRLHYSANQGIDWVDDWRSIFTFPAVGLAAFFVNVAFAAQLSKRDRLLGRMMIGATVLLEVALAVGGVIAVLLNG